MREKGLKREMEKRRSVRLEKTLPIKFGLPHLSDLPSFEALSRNIGEGGLFVETDLVQDETLALAKEMLLDLEVELLGHAQRVKSRGEIAWISRKSRAPQKRRNGFGVRFIQISPEEKRAISIFISKETLAQTDLLQKEIPEILREQKLTDRQRRNLEILDTIKKNRLISRAEISKATNINIVTVSNYIDNYLKKGLVFERGLDISSGGRRPELVEINPQYGYVLGVDLAPEGEGTSLQVVATDFTGRLKAKEKEKLDNSSIEDSLDILKDLIAEVCANSQVERRKIRGIGIGIPGIMDKFGGTVRNGASGATFANYVVLKKELEDEFNLPVFMENSAACALFAEKWAGISMEAKAADNILYIFSDGQCAMMLKGELYTGSSKSAGQLNFAPGRNNHSLISDYCWLNPARDCVFRVKPEELEMDIESKEDLTARGVRLGAKAAYLVNILNPQVVIIGRRLYQLGDIFLDTIRQTVSRFAYREGANIVRIIPATLGEEAVAVGAASLVIEAVFASI